MLVRVTTFFLLMLFGWQSFGQFADNVLEYKPAPGQMINTEGAGSHAAAASVVGGVSGLVSLGGFGGYIVLGFDQPILNHPDNPYGVDFTIFGNPYSNWAEPGIVMVMKDENGNGLPDDTWYELAGSDYFFATTRKNYRLSYANPNDGVNQHIPWYNNFGESGTLPVAGFYAQPYFPNASFFPEITADTLSYSGTCLLAITDMSNPGSVLSYPRAFGYADNRPRLSSNYAVPDNPYTGQVEGCGGDPMDISWAVDGKGQYVDLEQVDFVKIYTGVNQGAGWLGELSTEVKGVVVHAPDASIKGNQKMVVIRDLPCKMVAGQTALLEAFAFDSGRLNTDAVIEWSVDKSQLAYLEPNNSVSALAGGNVVITASVASDPAWKSQFQVEIVEIASVRILLPGSYLLVDETMEFSGQALDQQAKVINGIQLNWSVSAPEIISLENRSGKMLLAGKTTGEAWLKLQAGFFSDSVLVKVYEAAESKTVFITIKDKNGDHAIREKVNVSSFNLNDYVDRASRDYEPLPSAPPSVAHAIAAYYLQQGLSNDLRFRDDDRGNNQLYLWKVPFSSDGFTDFVYGYGGAILPEAFAKAWLVMHNNRHYANGLNHLEVKNNDEIVIYHQESLTIPWSFTQISVSNYFPTIAESVDFLASTLTCQMDGFQVSVTGSTPIADEVILINEHPLANELPVTFYTDNRGMATTAFTSGGLKLVSIAQTSTSVFVAYPTSNLVNSEQALVKVYPVPVKQFIFVEYQGFSSFLMELFNAVGSRVVSSKGTAGQRMRVDLAGTDAGIYFLVIDDGINKVTRKIVVK